MTTTASFVQRCETYRARRGISRSYLSRLLFNDGKTLEGLRTGAADVTVRRLDRAATVLGELERALAAPQIADGESPAAA